MNQLNKSKKNSINQNNTKIFINKKAMNTKVMKWNIKILNKIMWTKIHLILISLMTYKHKNLK